MWSYTPGGSAPKDQVRLLIGDTLPTDPQLQDEEVNAFIASRSTITGAAEACCLSLAAKFSRSVDFKAGQSSAKFSDLSKQYRLMALNFGIQAASSGAAMPYAGGISVTDKMRQESDTDRVEPQFVLGMDDNDLIPFGPAANETLNDAQN